MNYIIDNFLDSMFVLIDHTFNIKLNDDVKYIIKAVKVFVLGFSTAIITLSIGL